MTKIINISDLPVDPNNPNGPTIKDVNLKERHKIPVGALVEVKYDSWFGEGACIKAHARLWVVGHNRDCDGTPLYSLSDKKMEDLLHLAQYFNTSSGRLDLYARVYESGFAESSLTVVESTESLERGEGALCWSESS